MGLFNFFGSGAKGATERRNRAFLSLADEVFFELGVHKGNPTDPATTVWYSPKLTEVFGYRLEEFGASIDSWGKCVHPDDGEKVMKAFGAHLADRSGRTPFDVLYRFRHKNGSWRLVRGRVITERASDGTPLFVTGSMRDITELSAKQEQADTLISRLNVVSQAMSEGPWHMKYGEPGNSEHPDTWIWWSDKIRAMLGFRDESDFPNTVEAWVSRLHPDDVPKVFDLVARYSNDRTGTVAYDLVYRMKNKSGDYGWYRTIGHGERDAEGRVIYFGGVIRDLAVEKANEEYEMLAQNLIYQLREVASHLNAVGNEVHGRTDDLKRTASHQVGDVQRIATAMEEMTVTVNENTRLTEQAAKLADDARRDATSGGAIVSQTIDGMNSIADIVISSAKTVEQLGVTSDQIGAVAQVIEEIADQTNLLALNAAIEAARAGEQGRGFAVVADEVRKLAERTQLATREIAKTISSIQGETKTAVEAMTKGTHTVQEGRKLAEQASHALKSIISQSTSVAGLITQLAAASEQQVATINEIAGGVDSLSGAAESTAGATGEIAHKTNELAEIASTVQRLLDEIDVNSRDTDVRRQRRLR